MTYRKDIDGLRAIAVLGVIFYHSEIIIGSKIIFSGGFLGVDIFFVISGYLITTIIYQEKLNNKNFSFLNFYERRIRRLLPALLFVLCISLIFAYLLLLPVQFKSYLGSTISSIFFYSNFYFHYSGQAYGEAILSSKPLLHTWSLAVEEQFYLLYPIFFVYFIRFSKKNLEYILFFIIFLSILLVSNFGDKYASFNFYMIFTRAWELLIGCLLSLKHASEKRDEKNNKYLSFIGLLLILFSFIFFEEPHQHPSNLTLVPVIGCCLIIHNKKNNDLITNFLSNRIMINIGLISYSLYLWHHPILSFGKISGVTEENILLKIFLIIISFILSIFTYFLIEKKFRNKKIISNKILGVTIFPTIFFLIFLSFFLPNKQKKIYPEILENLHEKTWFTTKQFIKPCFQRKIFHCSFGDKYKNETVFLVGDSVMASFQEELKNNLLSRDLNFIPMTNGGCDFFNKDFKTGEKFFCNKKIQENRHTKIKKYKESTIILHLNYKNHSNNRDEYIKRFIKNIDEYLKLNYKIILLYPIPQFNTNISNKIKNKYFENKFYFLETMESYKNFIYLDYKQYKNETKKIFSIFDQLNHPNLYRFFPHDHLCNRVMLNRCMAQTSNDIYFIDNSHLSKKGSLVINSELIKLVDKIYFK